MWLWRLLLRLYPTSFRTEYESEMTADFVAQGGSVGPVLLAETVWNAAAAHFDILRQDLRWAMRSLDLISTAAALRSVITTRTSPR